MKRFLLYFWGLICVLCAENIHGQETEKEILCNFFDSRQKLGKRSFISTEPFLLRVDNVEHLYVEAQLGKRKNRIFLYLKVLEDNVCLKKEKNLDIRFLSGEMMTLKNDFPINCEGVWVRELSKKEIHQLLQNSIEKIQLFAYHKNYEIFLSEALNLKLQEQIHCLMKEKTRK